MMIENLLNKVKELSEAFVHCKGSIVFDGRNYNLTDNSKKQYFKSIGVEIEEINTECKIKIRTYLNPIKVLLFEELEQYFTTELADITFCVLNYEGKWMIFDSDLKIYHTNDQPQTLFSEKIKNYHIYQQTITLLRSSSFADHHNSADKEIVIYSSTKGILKITYDSILPTTINGIEKIYEHLKEIVREGQLKSILKNTLFTFANGKGKITFQYFLSEFWDICDVTNRDYEIVLKQFDFDKIRDLLIKEKDKFFTSIREVISKVFNQAIGIPISISATIFATYKIENETFTLWLVLIGFIIYVVFYIIIQSVYYSDVKELQNDFNNDFDVIKNKSGLDKQIIEYERKKIERRIRTSKNIITFLIGIILILGMTIVLFLLEQILEIEILKLFNPLNW